MAFGRLERTKGSEPMSDINVTPLVDVMLVLLVIFIITAPLLASSIRLDLPKTDAAKPGDPPKFVTVAVNRDGQAFFNDRPVKQPELSVALQAAARANPETEVQLRADQGVPYGRVVEVMGEAQKAGLNRIGFVADAPATPATPGAQPPAPAASQ
ncbi:biopolymer transporter ExbD [Ottowia sp.]|uniref:ExbD/TolR family protein n=1 Tax=Ottowia sp. TaxID=1898956 RepID=UPI002C15B2DD|nr:biopolymer transporter ExbD [Ottowia sp.]HOB65792.1 biopolymer transporter ExbD [Ottowia sp.]HPZ56633.1 biopolymer transporter ExbD [Ottowia sp.]HQD47098.1 biopolymer transporter ExbD [Ottowia sp.]